MDVGGLVDTAISMAAQIKTMSSSLIISSTVTESQPKVIVKASSVERSNNLAVELPPLKSVITRLHLLRSEFGDDIGSDALTERQMLLLHDLISWLPDVEAAILLEREQWTAGMIYYFRR